MKKIIFSTVDGVETAEDFSECTDTIKEDVVFMWLKDVRDGEVFGCEVSEEIYKKIDDEYGIQV